MLKTKCIKSEPQPEDGLRISVMSRHTLNDGITPDKDITPQLYNEWWPELAPPASLLGEYYKQGLPWADFGKAYLEHIRQPENLSQLHKLINLAKTATATVLCIEESPEFCHRRLLAEECLVLEPDLEVDIN